LIEEPNDDPVLASENLASLVRLRRSRRKRQRRYEGRNCDREKTSHRANLLLRQESPARISPTVPDSSVTQRWSGEEAARETDVALRASADRHRKATRRRERSSPR